MLCQIFPRGHARYEQSRFSQDLEDFSVWLQASGYSRDCLRGHLFRVRLSLERISQANSQVAYAAPQLQAAFGAHCTKRRRSALFRATQRAYERFLLSKGRLTISSVSKPFDPLCDRYREALRQERGLVAETIEQHDRTIRDFLNSALPAGESLKSLIPLDVDQYLARKSQEVGRHRLQHVVAHLRSFLRFCRGQGEIEQPLETIDAPRVHGEELPPRALPWPMVQTLLCSIDRASRSGWRDYAILYLMAHYGLRPCEIVSLRLDSIDWSRGTLKVEQRKTHSILMLPLARQTGSILRQYLKRGRPKSTHPQLFLRARSPAGALRRYAVSDIFEKRAQCGGLPEGYSAYSLRHAFAMRLLARGVGIKAIGDLLGHRHLGTTCQYLRLELDALRGVALPVPADGQG